MWRDACTASRLGVHLAGARLVLFSSVLRFFGSSILRFFASSAHRFLSTKKRLCGSVVTFAARRGTQWHEFARFASRRDAGMRPQRRRSCWKKKFIVRQVWGGNTRATGVPGQVPGGRRADGQDPPELLPALQVQPPASQRY